MKFDKFQLELLKQRYLFPGETPAGMFKRVSKVIQVPESESLMNAGLFLPNSPTLMNAGRPGMGQLSACFVLPVEDSIDSIYDTLKHTAKIHKSGGGTGFNFSKLRPRGDVVSTTKGVASGPVSFLRVYDVGTEVVKQGGLRRGANMGMLRVDHPDIREFLVCKTEEGHIRNFNISVSVTDEFMQAVNNEQDYALINPRNGEEWASESACEIWDLMVHQSWSNGEPGFFFVDTVNKVNPHPELGMLETCNPCVSGDTLILTDKGYFPIRDLVGLPVNVWNGEEFSQVVPRITGKDQPMLKITFSNGHILRCTYNHMFYLKDGEKIEAIRLQVGNKLQKWNLPNRDASRFIEVTGIEFDGVDDTVYCFTEPKRHRGCFNGIVTGQCGETPLLPYESCVLGSINLSEHVVEGGFDWEQLENTVRVGVEFLNGVIQHNQYPLPEIERATKRTNKIGLGVMGWADALIKLGIRYDDQEAIKMARRVMRYIQTHAHDQSGGRNYTVTTIAPTGSISLIAGCSGGIEPIFATTETRNQAGMTYVRKHPLLGLYDEDLFVTAHDVPWEMHIAHQAAFQEYTDNAISKTINMPNSATEQEVGAAIRAAYVRDCKGLTLYRDNSREEQVIAKECKRCAL